MVISSVNNEKIKYIKKLKNTKIIDQEGLFIVEGKHLVLEAYEAGLLTLTLSLDDVNYGVENIMVTENVLKSITSLTNVANVIGICKVIKEKEELGNKILILDGIQDPGNLGTIIRSSKAFGFTSIVLSPNCVKKYNDKVIRATQGMLFKTNVITRNIVPFLSLLNKEGYMVYATDVKSGVDVKKIDKTKKIAVIMGSEGSGVSKEIRKKGLENIYINIKKDCESLNVAVAASIIMYELQD